MSDQQPAGSDAPPGPGWWKASDGQWYPPEARVDPAEQPPQPGWWKASDGNWYPPAEGAADPHEPAPAPAADPAPVPDSIEPVQVEPAPAPEAWVAPAPVGPEPAPAPVGPEPAQASEATAAPEAAPAPAFESAPEPEPALEETASWEATAAVAPILGPTSIPFEPAPFPGEDATPEAATPGTGSPEAVTPEPTAAPYQAAAYQPAAYQPAAYQPTETAAPEPGTTVSEPPTQALPVDLVAAPPSSGRRSPLLMVLAGVAVLAVVVLVALRVSGSGDGDVTAAPSTTVTTGDVATTAPAAPSATVDAPPTSVEGDVPLKEFEGGTLGSYSMRMSGIDYSDQPGQMRRVSVHFTVTNTGDAEAPLNPSQFALQVPNGKVHAPSDKPTFDAKPLAKAEERSVAVTWLVSLEPGLHHFLFQPKEDGPKVSWTYTIG